MTLLARAPRRPLTCDAVAHNSDPTGTLDLRRRYGSLAMQRWRKVRASLMTAVVRQDVLGLSPGSVSAISILPGDGRTRAFQMWIDGVLRSLVVEGDGAWMRGMIAVAYARAVARAMRLTHKDIQPVAQTEQINALFQLCVVELQGICEAASQQIVRAGSLADLHHDKPIVAFRAMERVVNAIGITRSKAMINLMVVKAHATGTLDQFAQVGIAKVALVPESFPKSKHSTARDSLTSFHDAPRGFRGTGYGSRISREKAPSRSTIYRIAAQSKAVEEQTGTVSVQTAGDDSVCPICEDIESGGPYSIDEARSLIPAHPWCRCTFVPEDDSEGDDLFGLLGIDSRALLDAAMEVTNQGGESWQ